MPEYDMQKRVDSLKNTVKTEGIEYIKTKEGYTALMKNIENFPYRSFYDEVLIAIQCRGRPEPKMLAAFKTWKYKLNRQVKGNEKAIHTISYAPDFLVSPELAYDKKGNLLMPEWGSLNNSVKHEIIESAKERDTKVFDISQTVGDDIPKQLTSMKVKPDELNAFNDILKKTSPVPVYIEDFSKRKGLITSRDWAFDPQNNCLFVREHMSSERVTKALINGIARASSPEASSFEVDTVAYCVCDKFGIDTRHLDSLFENLDEKIDCRIKNPLEADTFDDFMSNMENNVIHAVSDIIGSVYDEMALEQERKTLNYEKEAEIFGIPALYTSRVMDPKEVPEGMYAYKIIGSNFNEKTGQVGGPFCLTNLNNSEADTNQGGTVVVPSYISLNESGFLRLGSDDLVFADTGPLKDTMERLTHTDLNGILQNKIIQSNEEILWTDHGSRFALYHANDNVPYKYMSDYEVKQKGYEINASDYHLAYGGRAGNNETLKDFLSRFKSDSDDRPVDYRGHALSVGDIVVINQYGCVTAGMYNHDGSIVEVPRFTENRCADMLKSGTNMSLENYMQNGGLKDRWAIGEKESDDYLRICIYTKPVEGGEEGQFDYYTQIKASDREWILHAVDRRVVTRDDKSLHDFCSNILEDRQKNRAESSQSAFKHTETKSEKSDGRGVIERGIYEHKQKEQMPKMSIFGPNFENSIHH